MAPRDLKTFDIDIWDARTEAQKKYDREIIDAIEKRAAAHRAAVRRMRGETRQKVETTHKELDKRTRKYQEHFTSLVRDIYDYEKERKEEKYSKSSSSKSLSSSSKDSSTISQYTRKKSFKMGKRSLPIFPILLACWAGYNIFFDNNDKKEVKQTAKEIIDTVKKDDRYKAIASDVKQKVEEAKKQWADDKSTEEPINKFDSKEEDDKYGDYEDKW